MSKNKISGLSSIQEQNLQYFKQNLADWLNNPVYQYKYLVIHGSQVKGVYDRPETALENAIVTLPQGEFIIQQVIDENEIVNSLSRAL